MLLGKLTLLVILALSSSHLRGENTRGDGVDTDLETTALDLGREHLVEMDNSALGSVVVEVALGDTDETRDGRDIDDGARPTMSLLSGLLQKRQEGSTEEERSNDVGGVDVAPVLEAETRVSQKRFR